MGDDGAPEDIFRLQDQLDRIRAWGFEITDSNGLANMVAWWQQTDHALVPGDDPISAVLRRCDRLPVRYHSR